VVQQVHNGHNAMNSQAQIQVSVKKIDANQIRIRVPAGKMGKAFNHNQTLLRSC